ncbi:MAG: tRNA preQ1(34) S-adenosylmethionine ribosyltransferase-isomerase QueA [Verrucomicrobiales bacterium]
MSVPDWRTADFNYHLPPDLIASRPPPRRDAARLMVVDRAAGTIQHAHFTDFRSFLRPGDIVVLNDTRVVKARFFSDDRLIELLRLDVLDDGQWRCLVKPGRRLRLGHTVSVGGSTGTVTGVDPADGARRIRWDAAPEESVHGHLALPHYMGRGDDAADEDRYQTTFARSDRAGAIAAPTAGLHFTRECLESIPHCFLTLHVGVGTFRPVTTECIADHIMHSEQYELSDDATAQLQAATRIVAVGTTVTRVLEHVARTRGRLVADRGRTDIFIYPPFDFRAVGALLTNFHLPQSTLLMLVSAFAGRDLVLRAYAEAVRKKYRFFSYGDCMLLI